MATTNPLDLPKTLVGQYSFIYDSDRTATLANFGLNRESLDGTVVAVTDGATPSIDWSVANLFTWTSAVTSTLSFTNTSVNGITVAITGGSASVITWPTVIWVSGNAAVSPANSQTLYVRFTKIGATIYAEDVSESYTLSRIATNSSAITTLQTNGTQVSTAVTDGASVAINWNTANVFRWTTAQTTTVTFTNTAEGSRTLVLTGSGSSSAITWPTITWNGGTAPSAIANTKTQIIKIRKVSTTFYGNVEVAN